MSLLSSVLNQMPARTWENIQSADAFWQNFRTSQEDFPQVVHTSTENLGELDCDVIVCGGTLGIAIACALQQKGWQVMVIERGALRGREQEWNISRHELSVFLELELLSASELETAIATEYNPGRISFLGGKDIWVRDVLNIGIDPVFLLETLKQKFLNWGGKLLEHTKFQSVTVSEHNVCLTAQNQDGVEIKIKARLLLDVMGHFSPIARQARQGAKPDAVCLVVGSCARGIEPKPFGDLITTFTPIQNQCQYFWEAFPAKDGRTTYMFTYADVHLTRPNFSQLLEDYLSLLPQYQDVDLHSLQFQRVLYGFFPSYRRSPLSTPWPRMLQIGDSSGAQSPLSFGGFGALVRHLGRLTEGLHAALQADLLRAQDLQLLQPYQPNLAVTWLFQQAMSVPVGQSVEGDRINRLLSTVFNVMEQLGEPILKPFLQDVVQFAGLSQTMAGMAVANPRLVATIVQQVGVASLLDWLKHYSNLGFYSAIYPASLVAKKISQNLLPEQQYYWQCWLDAWRYGSGADYQR